MPVKITQAHSTLNKHFQVLPLHLASCSALCCSTTDSSMQARFISTLKTHTGSTHLFGQSSALSLRGCLSSLQKILSCWIIKVHDCSSLYVDMQANFTITLETRTGLTALSNMPVRATHHHEQGWTSTHFETSPAMSTYLVAMIMGNLTSVSTMVPHPEPGHPPRNVSIYGTPERYPCPLFIVVMSF